MKKKIKNNRIKISALVILLALFSGCSEYFENPLKDKETGKDVNLLLLDFNFFNTRMTYKFYDATDNSLITEPAKITFTGLNGNDIVTFAGEKNSVFNTSEGQLELTIDPNVEISESNPFEFAVKVEIDGYNKFTKGFQFRNKGKKTMELKLSKIAEEDDSILDGEININEGDTSIIFFVQNNFNVKSAEVEKPYVVNYKISINDLIHFRDTNGDSLFATTTEAYTFLDSPDNSISISVKTFSGYSPETDVINDGGTTRSVLFQKLETGKLDEIIVSSPGSFREVADLHGGKINSTCTYNGEPVPDVFGFGIFGDGSWDIIGTETNYTSLDFDYTLVKASLEELCETGSSITFNSNSISSFSIDADVYDSEDKLITTLNFKGNFPETFVMENTPSRAVRIVFRDNNTSFAPIAPLEIDNFCQGSYNVDVTATDGYDEYQIVLKALCPDNLTIAIAPTYSAEIKIKGSADLWQGIDMIGGKVDLLGKPNKEYELRLFWNEAWEYSTYSTKFNTTDGSYIGDSYPKTVITSAYIEENARIRINVERIFNQNVCEDMGW